MLVSNCCKVATKTEKSWRHGEVVVCSFCYQPCESIDDGGEQHGTERLGEDGREMGAYVG